MKKDLNYLKYINEIYKIFGSPLIKKSYKKNNCDYVSCFIWNNKIFNNINELDKEVEKKINLFKNLKKL